MTDPGAHLLLPGMQRFQNIDPLPGLNATGRDEMVNQFTKRIPVRFRNHLRQDAALRKKRNKFHGN